jgi:hypothetical protein
MPASPAASVHFEVRVFPEIGQRNKRSTIAQGEPVFGAAVGAVSPAGRDKRAQLVWRSAAAKRRTQIDTLCGIETEVPEAVGCQPAAVATAAKGIGCRGDDAEDGAIR